LFRQDAVFADIGTDHAYLPIFLLREGRIRRAFCSDVNEGPLNKAKENAIDSGIVSGIEFYLTDGAAELFGKGITDFAICGMGGELIARIISEAPFLRDEGINLILQPMTKQAYLRRYLAEEGFSVKAEAYSADGHKNYVCFLVSYTG
jgi:tRNA (adenine22-N1)-methyltransferase